MCCVYNWYTPKQICYISFTKNKTNIVTRNRKLWKYHLFTNYTQKRDQKSENWANPKICKQKKKTIPISSTKVNVIYLTIKNATQTGFLNFPQPLLMKQKHEIFLIFWAITKTKILSQHQRPYRKESMSIQRIKNIPLVQNTSQIIMPLSEIQYDQWWLKK